MGLVTLKNRELVFAAFIFYLRPWCPRRGPIVPPAGFRNRRRTLCRDRTDFGANILEGGDRRLCSDVAVRRFVDAHSGQRSGGFSVLVGLFRRRGPLGPNPVIGSGRRASYARTWGLVDRCPPVWKKTADARAVGGSFPLERVNPFSTSQ